MKQSAFKKIEQRYAKYSSFAVWDLHNVNDVSVIKDNITKLHARVVFIGLNPSGQINNEFKNFHTIHQGGRDSWLAEAIGNNPVFFGCYMTDLIKNDLSSKSSNVLLNRENITSNLKLLKKELSIFQEKNPVLIAFGDKVFYILKDNGFKPLKLVHYASRITKKYFCNQVKLLSQKVIRL